MKKWLISLVGIFVLFSASAATIQWGAAQNISSDSDVPSVSTYSARNVGGSATETVNGVAFSSPSDISMDGPAYNDFGTASGLSASYQNLLKCAQYDVTTITLSGLVVGTNYEVQVWANDSRSAGSGRNTVLDGAVTLDQNDTEAEGGKGQYALGTFTADATSQTISVTGSGSAVVNAVLVYSSNSGGNSGGGGGATGYTPPTPVRWWQWHGGTNWAANGVDPYYRVEAAWQGMALGFPKFSFYDGEEVYSRQFMENTDPDRMANERIYFDPDGTGWYRMRVHKTDGTDIYFGASTDDPKKNISLVQVNVYNGTTRYTPSAVTQSSTSGSYAASNANDDDDSTFSLTTQEYSPFLQVDLGADKTVSKIVGQCRKYTAWSMRDATIQLWTSAGGLAWWGHLYGSREFYEFDLPAGITGRYIKFSHNTVNDPNTYMKGSTGLGGDEKLWKPVLADSHGLYKIYNKSTGEILQMPLVEKSPDYRSESGNRVHLVSTATNDWTVLWTIEPVRDDMSDRLGVSQIGWTPKALKFAILVRSNALSSAPYFTVTSGSSTTNRTIELDGYGHYYGTFYGKHFYELDLSDLQTEGDFWLDCDGDRADIHIADDAYRNIRHRGGSDTVHLSDIVGGRGFVGYWSRITNWCTSAELCLEPHNWKVVTDFYSSAYGDTEELIQPLEPIDDKYLGGWDHTDRAYGSFQGCAELMRQLVFAWEETDDPTLKAALENEMEYGATYFINTQFSDGSWPFRSYVKNKLSGTTAACGSVLAAAYPIVKQTNPTLAADMLSAAQDAETWVENNNVWISESYRHGHSEDRMMLALELYRITGNTTLQNIAQDMILNAEIKTDGHWGKISGSFDGEDSEDRGTIQCLVTLMHYYPEAPSNVQDAIDEQLKDYFNFLLGLSSRNGPCGIYEGDLYGYGSGARWARRAAFFYRLYAERGQRYGAGVFLADRIMDWNFGANPYASSFTYGFGDQFGVYGWVRGYEIGSLLPGITKDASSGEYTIQKAGYGNSESEAAAGVALIRFMILRDKMRNNPPQCATLYDGTGYTGESFRLPLGARFNANQIKAYGGTPDTASSIKNFPGLAVHLFDGGTWLGGIYGSSSDLGSNSDKADEVLAEFNLGMDTFSEWASTYGISSTPDADPDGDGISNLGEYAAGTDPTVANTPPGGIYEMGKDGFKAVEFQINGGASDLDFLVERAPTLKTPIQWTPMNGAFEHISATGALETIRMDIADLVGTNQFIRIRSIKP
jgi:hypothetical protein